MESINDDIFLHDDKAARTHLEAARWPSGPICPFCGETEAIERLAPDGEGLRCTNCGQAFTVATGSLMEHSRLPLSKWLTVLRQLNGTRDWSASSQIAQLFGMLTTDPDLRIVADGRPIRAVSVTRLTHRFMIPAGTLEIVILSRSVVPAEIQANQRDFRRLGVCIQEIRLVNDDIALAWPATDPLLQDGFYPPEGSHRWTTGRAVLPSLRAYNIAKPATFDIQLNDAQLHYALPVAGKNGPLK